MTTLSQARPLFGALLLASGLLAGGCAHRGGGGRVVVAVMPVETMGVPAAEGASLHRALLRELALSASARPTGAAELQQAAAREPCRDSDECLARLGRRVAASLVLASTLAGLGDMRLVRARLLRSSDALVVQDLQETIPGAGGALDQRAGDLVKRMFPESGGRAWYRRWYVWAVVAGVVGATVGVTVWAATRGGEPRDPNLHHLGDL